MDNTQIIGSVLIALLCTLVCLGFLCLRLLSKLYDLLMEFGNTVAHNQSAISTRIEALINEFAKKSAETGGDTNRALHLVTKNITDENNSTRTVIWRSLQALIDAIQEGPLPFDERKYREARTAFFVSATVFCASNIGKWSRDTEILLIGMDVETKSRFNKFVWMRLRVRKIVEVGNPPKPYSDGSWKKVIFGWREGIREKSHRVKWTATDDDDLRVGSLVLRFTAVNGQEHKSAFSLLPAKAARLEDLAPTFQSP